RRTIRLPKRLCGAAIYDWRPAISKTFAGTNRFGEGRTLDVKPVVCCNPVTAVPILRTKTYDSQSNAPLFSGDVVRLYGADEYPAGAGTAAAGRAGQADRSTKEGRR